MAIKMYNGPTLDRSRETILRPSLPIQRKNIETFYPSGTTQITYATQVSIPASKRWLRSVSVPGFEKLKAEGWIIQNPYSSITEEHVVRPGNWLDQWYFGVNGALSSTWESQGVVSGLSQSLFPSASHINRDKWNRAKDEALTRAFSKANSSSATLLVDVSQWKQTARMFKQNILRARELFRLSRGLVRNPTGRYLKKRMLNWVSKRSPMSRADQLSGLWVELRFGWRPLLVSLDGIQQAILLQAVNRPTRKTFRATEKFHHESKDVFVNGWNPGGAFWPNAVQDVYTTTTTWDSSFRAGLLIEPWERSLSQEFGFELEQIPYAAWDLVPWSFIVDRFANIGNYLSAMRPIPGNAFGGAWVVERFTYRESYVSRFLPASITSGSKKYVRSLGETAYEIIRHGTIRTLHSAPPSLPVLRHDWDSINDIHNVIDGIALSIQALQRQR